MKSFQIALVAAALFYAGAAFAEPDTGSEKEPAAVIELGASGEQSLKGAGSSFGPSVAIEGTPIKGWPTLQLGVAPFFSHGDTDVHTELLVKTPWKLSEKAEISFGIGPEWLHASGHGDTTDSLGGEVLIELMYWPTQDRRFGWYVGPSYGYDFGKGHEQAVGLTGGLLIAFP